MRHAQSTCNVLPDSHLINASHDQSPLTELGRRQAQALAGALPAALCGGRIFCSPMHRALETAGALAAARGLDIVTDARLEEVALRGERESPVSQADWDQILARRIRYPDQEVGPGVESLKSQFERVRAFLADRHETRGTEPVTLIVSHAMTLELALVSLLGLDVSVLQRFRFRLSNTGVHVVESGMPGTDARLLMVNALTHLDRWV